MVETLEMPAAESAPLVKFDPSQRRLFDDRSRVLVVNWHRQKGKDFTFAAKAVDTAFRNGKNWYIVSLTQRQADATHKKAEKFFDAFRGLMRLKAKATYSEYEFEEFDDEINQTFIRKARKLILPNKAEIVALPGKDPDTLAGESGNVLFTEFGLFPKGGYQHWRTVFPLATRGYQVGVISTPRGKKHKFFELCSKSGTYSYHFCPIDKSVTEDGYRLEDNNGNPCSMEEYKKIYGDDAGWQREYMCEFTGDMDALISWAQLLSAQDAEVAPHILRIEDGNGWDESFFNFVATLAPGRLEVGWDVARKEHLSSIWINLAGRDGKKRLVALILMRNTEYPLMQHIAEKAMRSRQGSVGCGDATGLGNESNERLKAKFRDNWESLMFSPKTKSELGSLGRAAFADGTQKLPPFADDGSEMKFIAMDIYSVQCQPTGDPADKRLILSETENELEPHSHCDIAWSGFMANRAGTLVGGRQRPLPKPQRTKPPGW